MWVTEEVSLVEFYRSGLRLAREAGYDIVLCFIAREADAPDAYNELIGAWQSIDDLTGPKILFLFAGPSARVDHKSDNIYLQHSERLIFSQDVLMLPSKRLHSGEGRTGEKVKGHYDLQYLRQHTKENHPRVQRGIGTNRILARHQPLRPRLEDIATPQTSQIRKLRDFLSLREQDIPCLHFTFLDDNRALHRRLASQVNIYATLRSIVEVTESEGMRNVRAEISRLRERQGALGREQQELERDLGSPERLFRSVTVLLENAVPLGSEQKNEIQEFLLALRLHATRPSEESRKGAFHHFKSVRPFLSGHSSWNVIKSSVQRLIDVASYSRPMDVLWNPEATANAATRISEEIDRLEVLKREQEQKLEAMLTLPEVQSRENKNESSCAKAFLESFIVVAARQELDAIRAFLDSEGAHRETYHLSESWQAERVSVDQGLPIEFTLIPAPGQGVEDMMEVLNFIQGSARPKTVILVGMMAGIPGKSRLLDVQAPRNIVDGSRLGLRGGMYRA